MRKAKRYWVIGSALLVTAAHGADRGNHPGEILARQAPADYRSVFVGDRNGVSVQEFIPNAEVLQSWTSMVTIQIFKAKADVKPGKFLVEFGQNYASSCPGLSHTNVLNGSANGYDVSMLAIQCPAQSRTGKPETLYVRAIQGSDRFYVIQFAYGRAPTEADKILLERYFESAIVCDPRTPEHPCPTR